MAALLALVAYPSPGLAQEAGAPAAVGGAATIRTRSKPQSPSPIERHSTRSSRANSAKSTADKKISASEGAGMPFATSHGPINIRSEKLSLDYRTKAILFSGHVHAVQSGTELSSDTLHVNYQGDFKDVKDVTADGNVRITQGGRWATAEHAVLRQQPHTVVMTGNPVVHDGPDQITGTRITVYLDTGKSVVEGARAVIFPNQSETADNGVTGDHAADTPPADHKTAGRPAPRADTPVTPAASAP